MGSELESIIQYFIDNKVPCLINRNAGPCLQHEPNSVFRVSSYVMLTGSAIVECTCVLTNQTESHQVYCAKMPVGPTPSPQKADDTMKAEKLNLENQISQFIHKQIPAKFDNEVLYHDPKSPCQVKHWQITEHGLLVTLANPNNKGYQVSSIVTKVMMPPRFVFEDKDKDTNQAVRSSDADAVAFHLISPHALERIAARYQMGSSKYGDYNWTKGFSWGQIINHSLRHIFHYLAGDRREDHLAGAAWGLLTLMHYEETRTGTDDLLRYSTTFDGIAPKGTDTPTTP